MADSRLHPAIRCFGELGLRVNDLAATTTFYRDVVGLAVFDAGPGYVFFRVADALEGHPQLLVLFDRGVAVGPATTTLDHFAFVIAATAYERERRRLEDLGLAVVVKQFPHFQWRSLFFADPEGNTVEFVAYDPTVGVPD